MLIMVLSPYHKNLSFYLLLLAFFKGDVKFALTLFFAIIDSSILKTRHLITVAGISGRTINI